MNFYLVGGTIRDRLMGLRPKDIDISVEASSWDEFRDTIRARHQKIFIEEESFFRIKALGESDGRPWPIDYTMCRKDGFYTDGRHPDSIEICKIHDDLSRRDFTINAIAQDLASGELLDPFNGRMDLEKKLLRCVGNAEERMQEDGLRWFRALRFTITKGFYPTSDLLQVMFDMMQDPDTWFKNTSTDRIREELRRCFFHSTKDTLEFLLDQRLFDTKLFYLLESRGLWLLPTTQQKMGHGA